MQEFICMPKKLLELFSLKRRRNFLKIIKWICAKSQPDLLALPFQAVVIVAMTLRCSSLVWTVKRKLQLTTTFFPENNSTYKLNYSEQLNCYPHQNRKCAVRNRPSVSRVVQTIQVAMKCRLLIHRTRWTLLRNLFSSNLHCWIHSLTVASF